jgi:mRNA-degrading endonuclease RelE of RelBE toxin-antitoxin system
MSWDFQLAKAAERALRSLPEKDKARINRALNEMKGNPFSGDVVPLKGEYKGLFRRRVGSWRIIFSVNPEQRVILVGDIIRRTSTTY